MPQSRNVRVNEISQHPEHTAERAGASHLNQAHELTQEKDQKKDGKIPPPQQHEGVAPAGKAAKKK